MSRSITFDENILILDEDRDLQSSWSDVTSNENFSILVEKRGPKMSI